MLRMMREGVFTDVKRECRKETERMTDAKIAEIRQLVISGKTNRDIANALSVSMNSVNYQRHKVAKGDR